MPTRLATDIALVTRRALLIADWLPYPRVHAALYRLYPPMPQANGTDICRVILWTRPDFPGVYIYPAKNKLPEVDEFNPLPGSFHGGSSHAAALMRAGYATIE